MLSLLTHGNNQAKTEASRQTDKQLPSTGEKTNRGLFVTGLLKHSKPRIPSKTSYKIISNNRLFPVVFLLFRIILICSLE